MIPRYDPTYTYTDLLRSYQHARLKDSPARLREQLAKIVGVKHVFLLESARVGLYLLLQAYGRPGEVVLPAYNCIVVPEAITFAGYRPVFADIDYATLNMSLDTLKARISGRTRVVMATHLFGIPCPVDELVEFCQAQHLLLVEDAAPALGARFNDCMSGLFGDAAILSFQSSKVVAAESGGALLTNRDDLAEKINQLLEEAYPWKSRLFAGPLDATKS